MSIPAFRTWIQAARPRTLPLALASIGMGSFLAVFKGDFRLPVLLLASLTTIFLQILSNLANDYGDSLHGADTGKRAGPERSVQSGKITASQMKKAIIWFIILSFISGIALLWVSLASRIYLVLLFLGLGLFALWAAYNYTAGKRPYGYSGLGDIFVLIFFGFVGVAGTYFLHTKQFELPILLPALSCGCFSMAVLNVNNIRDMESDEAAGKYSLPVRIGRKRAVWYHWLLLTLGFSAIALFTVLYYNSVLQWIYVLTLPLFIRNAIAVKEIKDPVQLDPHLRQLALSTLLLVITFGMGLMFLS